MERSGNFYKAIRLGYILISILIGCMAYLLICTCQLNLRFPNKMSMVKKVKKSSHFC